MYIYITLQTIIDPTLFSISLLFFRLSTNLLICWVHTNGNFKRTQKKRVRQKGVLDRKKPATVSSLYIYNPNPTSLSSQKRQLVIKLTRQFNRSEVL